MRNGNDKMRQIHGVAVEAGGRHFRRRKDADRRREAALRANQVQGIVPSSRVLPARRFPAGTSVSSRDRRRRQRQEEALDEYENG